MASLALHTHILCPSNATKVLFIEWIHRIQAANTVNRQPIFKPSGEQTDSMMIRYTYEYLIVVNINKMM